VSIMNRPSPIRMRNWRTSGIRGFRQLPARVRPEDLVEAEEAEPVHEEPGQPMVRREWG